MVGRVLIAVEVGADNGTAITYGIKLAARIGSSLTVMGIMADEDLKKGRQDESIAEERSWLERVAEASREQGFNPELLLGRGNIFSEVIRFISFNESVEFVVLAVPENLTERESRDFSEFLERLDETFEGEILLVRKHGRITGPSGDPREL